MLPLILKSFVHHSFGSKNNWVVFMTASLPWFSYIKTLLFFFKFIYSLCHSLRNEPGWFFYFFFLLHHKLVSCCVMIYCLRETNHNQICAWRRLQRLEVVVTVLVEPCKYTQFNRRTRVYPDTINAQTRFGTSSVTFVSLFFAFFSLTKVQKNK